MDKLPLILIGPIHYLLIYWIHSKFKHPKNEVEKLKKPFLLLFKDYIYTPALIVIILGYIFFNQYTFLQQFLVPISTSIKSIGLIMYILGFALKFWAYSCLGSSWSSKITIYQNHKLVDFGPYSTVRHPVYVSYMMTFIGLSIYCGNLLLLLLSIGYVIMNAIRAKQEEILLFKKFGLSYEKYMLKTGAFIPKITSKAFIVSLLILILVGFIIGGISEINYLLTKNSFTYKIVNGLLQLIS